MLVEKVKKNIIEYDMINSGDTVLVGVSGGYDSIMLLDILYKLKEELKFELAVAHVNHGVRGFEADQDEEFVKKTAEKYGLRYFAKKVDMEGYAKRNKITDEESGRILRYGFFREVLKDIAEGKQISTKIAVAHNKNDQAETILMRIMRGTGLDGLRGIEYVNQDIIRPILNISREEIESYCEENMLNPRLDSTNLKAIYNRNKVRLELIPYIQENFNDNIVDTLFRLTESAVRDSEILKKVADSKYEKVVLSSGDQFVIIDNEKFSKLDYNIKGRVVRKSILEAFGNLVGIEEKHINNAIFLSDSKTTGKSIDMPNDIRIKLEYDKLYIEKSENNSKVSYNYRIDINKELSIVEIDAILKFEIIDRSRLEYNRNRNTEYFDYDDIDGEIFVRNRIDGDRVKLFGLSGTKKLKDFFIDQKIPKEKRDEIPLLVFGDEIAWISGYRRSRLAPITENTKTVLKVEYFQR